MAAIFSREIIAPQVMLEVQSEMARCAMGNLGIHLVSVVQCQGSFSLTKAMSFSGFQIEILLMTGTNNWDHEHHELRKACRCWKRYRSLRSLADFLVVSCQEMSQRWMPPSPIITIPLHKNKWPTCVPNGRFVWIHGLLRHFSAHSTPAQAQSWSPKNDSTQSIGKKRKCSCSLNSWGLSKNAGNNRSFQWFLKLFPIPPAILLLIICWETWWFKGIFSGIYLELMEKFSTVDVFSDVFPLGSYSTSTQRGCCEYCGYWGYCDGAFLGV